MSSSYEKANASIKAAAEAAYEARANESIKLRAFELCEIAIEHIRNAPLIDQDRLARSIIKILNENAWLKVLRLRLIPLLASAEKRLEFIKFLEAPDVPRRIARQSFKEAGENVVAISKLLISESDIENDRIKLRRPKKSSYVETDSVDWKFSLPPYLNCTPNFGSFYNDENFENNLLLLTHELVHVLSFRGAIGYALTAFRVAELLVANEISSSGHWDLDKLAKLGSTTEELDKGTISTALKLVYTATQLEIKSKNQALLSTWAPWLEGVAVFCEQSGLEKDSIPGENFLVDYLIGLSDVALNETDLKNQEEIFKSNKKEFGDRWNEAIANNSTNRLLRYFRQTNSSYFHGYIAIRALTASWRRTTGINLSSMQCVRILLHATKFGSYDFLPDLSLQSKQFEVAAMEGMKNFTSKLAYLSKKELLLLLGRNEFNQHVPGTHRIRWHDGSVSLSATENKHEWYEEFKTKSARKQTLQALRSLENALEFSDLSPANPSEREHINFLAKIVRFMNEKIFSEEALQEEHARIYMRFIASNTILPIGTSQSAFYLQIMQEENIARLWVNLRNTEKHVKTGTSQYNYVSFPLSIEEGAALDAAYRKNLKPTIDVSRVLVLADINYGMGKPARYPHLLSLTYPGWSMIMESSALAANVRRVQPPVWQELESLVDIRMQDNDLRIVEKQLVSKNKDFIDSAHLMLAEINASRVFEANELIAQMAGQLRLALDNSQFNPYYKLSRQKQACIVLICQMYHEREWAMNLATADFMSLTDNITDHRASICDALATTATASDEAGEFDYNGLNDLIGGVKLFEKTSGWDVIAVNNTNKDLDK